MSSFSLLVFCITVLPLIFMPGPDIIYITTRGIAQGRRAAVISTLGVCAGYVVHTMMAVAGLTAVLYASEFLFKAIRYAGAAYLLYLGVKTLRSKVQFEPRGDHQAHNARWLFLTGMATSVMNPKGILLFLAYLPQFVSQEAGPVPAQLLVVGTLFTFMCGVVYGTYAVFSSAIGQRLSRAPRFADAMRWLTASVLMGLGLRLLIPERR
jgi:threonine/homoserine/homoserine lactone efflux protein